MSLQLFWQKNDYCWRTNLMTFPINCKRFIFDNFFIFSDEVRTKNLQNSFLPSKIHPWSILDPSLIHPWSIQDDFQQSLGSIQLWVFLVLLLSRMWLQKPKCPEFWVPCSFKSSQCQRGHWENVPSSWSDQKTRPKQESWMPKMWEIFHIHQEMG